MFGIGAVAQDLPATGSMQNQQSLDPTRNITDPVLESSLHKPLPEEYIWVAGDAETPKADAAKPYFFRHQFSIATVPAAATLYLAGPHSVKVWLNGKMVGHAERDASSPLSMHVFAMQIEKFLRSGENTIAVEATRGDGVSGAGQALVVKLLPLAPWVNETNTAPLTMSDGNWKGSTKAAADWQSPSFKDADWQPVHSFGGIESSIEFLQRNSDAGLYDWPGYDGISSFLAHVKIPAQKIIEQYPGQGQFIHLNAITSAASSSGELEVKLPATTLTDAEAPSVFLDFGKELVGRVEIVSDSDSPATVTVQMGESEAEALHEPYLGIDQLTIPAHGTAYGPKSAFRYVKLRFVGGGPSLRFKAIHVDDIYYPVKYAGSFESSDPMLNKIWETGAYTAHLCMQDDIWDASKRDRARWMGDTDVSGRVIEDVFGDKPLMEDTLDRLMGPAPIENHVNGIPGYSSFWFTEVADYYRHTGSKEFLESEHARLLQLLNYVDGEFDARGVFANTRKQWLFVDWSPELNGDTPETRRATTLEFYRAYRDAVWLLRQLGDNANADKYQARAAAIEAGTQKYLLDPATETYGPRWQTNAAAVISGAARPQQYPAIWSHVLSNVGHIKYNALIITPYYNYYVIRAMAEMNHRKDALAWIRQYWGGMIDEGATSFWEGYDPSWYKGNFHAALQADDGSGYFVSLAHGWSSGPTAWLMEQILGIEPTAAGFSTVNIRPDLADLSWAKGAEPTPHGLLKVDVRRDASKVAVTVDVPEGVVAKVAVPVTSASAHVLVNGKAQKAVAAENGTRMIVTLDSPGHYTLGSK
jgi:hypothetical protein